MMASVPTVPVAPSVSRALARQGLGGRTKTLRNRHLRRTVAVLLVTVGLGVLFVWTRMEVLQVRYAMSALQKRTEDYRQRRNRLALVVTAQKAPERLDRVAKDQLGMRVPEPGQIVFVQEPADGAAGGGNTVAAGR